MKVSIASVNVVLTRGEALSLMAYLKESNPPWDNSWSPGYTAKDLIKSLEDLGVKDA